VRNLLYAVEWWVFGAFAVLIWWRWVQEQSALDSPRQEAEPEPHPEDEPEDEDEERPDTVRS
jgi:hypothetical protein